jgi:hypothetical protein
MVVVIMLLIILSTTGFIMAAGGCIALWEDGELRSKQDVYQKVILSLCRGSTWYLWGPPWLLYKMVKAYRDLPDSIPEDTSEPMREK